MTSTLEWIFQNRHGREFTCLGRKVGKFFIGFSGQLLADWSLASGEQCHLPRGEFPTLDRGRYACNVKPNGSMCVWRPNLFTWWPALTSSRARKRPMKRVPPIIKMFLGSTAVPAEAVTTALRAAMRPASLTMPISTPSREDCHNHTETPQQRSILNKFALPNATKREHTQTSS